MTATIVLTLAFGALLAFSYGEFASDEDMGFAEMVGSTRLPPMDADMDDADSDDAAHASGGPKSAAQVAKNIAYVLEKLSFMVVKGKGPQKKLLKLIKKGTKCVQKAQGLDVRYVHQFVLAIPAGINCVTQTLNARNKKQQDKAVACFVKRLANFQQATNMPMKQVKKLQHVIDCLKNTLLKGRIGYDY